MNSGNFNGRVVCGASEDVWCKAGSDSKVGIDKKEPGAQSEEAFEFLETK